MIDLRWHEIRQVFVEDLELYQALYDVYINYIGNEDDSIDEIIEGIQDNIENYIEELILNNQHIDVYIYTTIFY